MPDPITLASGGLQTIIGLGQSLFSGRKKAERDLERQANSFQPNQSILDYYNKALAKYNPNPYNSQQYQQQSKQINRNMAGAINAAQDRRSGLATINTANQIANDSYAKAGVDAERMAAADLSRLGQAAGMKTAEEQKKFDMLYNLKAMKAGAASQRQNAGLRNIFGGISTIAGGGNFSGDSSEDEPGARAYRMPRMPAF